MFKVNDFKLHNSSFIPLSCKLPRFFLQFARGFTLEAMDKMFSMGIER